MQKVGTKIFMDLFSEIDLGILKQRYVDSLCYNSLETPCRRKTGRKEGGREERNRGKKMRKGREERKGEKKRKEGTFFRSYFQYTCFEL